jgi:hypothetical protein
MERLASCPVCRREPDATVGRRRILHQRRGGGYVCQPDYQDRRSSLLLYKYGPLAVFRRAASSPAARNGLRHHHLAIGQGPGGEAREVDSTRVIGKPGPFGRGRRSLSLARPVARPRPKPRLANRTGADAAMATR